MISDASTRDVVRDDSSSCSPTEQVREIIALTVLLREQEKLTDAADNRADWLRDVALTLMNQPSWWSLLPASWRSRRQRRLLRRNRLFDGDAYLARYPDVAVTRIDPLRHYLSYGIKENRLRSE